LFGLKAIVSAALVAYLLNRIGVGEALSHAKALSSTTVVTVFGLLVVYTTISALRWQLVLRALDCETTIGTTIRITFIGAFFNQFVPVGNDVARVWESYRSGFGLAKTFDSVLLERAGYVVAVSLIAATGTALWDQGRLPAVAVPTLWLVVIASVTATIALSSVDRFPSRLLPRAVAGGAAALAGDTRMLLRRPRHMAAFFLAAIVNQGLVTLAVLAVAHNLGVRLDPVDCMVLMPAVMLASSVPISVAGWGVREVAMVTAFGYAGVPGAAALVISLMLSLISVAAALPGAALWLTRRRRLAA
jgi:uncharacterized membrane protein YbhN (UPF0104 family)